MARSLLLVGLVSLFAAPAHGQCPSDKPVLIGGLKCDDAAAKSWHQVEVYRRCVVKRGQAQAALEVAERTPAGQKIRRTLSHGAVQGFVQDQTLAGHRQPQLFITKLAGGTTKNKQICGEQTRTNLGSLTCEAGSKSLRFDVDLACAKVLGQPLSILYFVDRSGNKPKTRKSVNLNDARVITLKNKGQPNARIWQGKGANKSTLEATALFNRDGRAFDLVKLRIAPKGGQECTRIIEVKKLWHTTWPVVPRLGFVEAVGVPSRDISRIDQVIITISPVKSPPCQRVIDTSAIWTAYP